MINLLLVPVFDNQKKSKGDFHFYKKKQKAKIALSVHCVESCAEAEP